MFFSSFCAFPRRTNLFASASLVLTSRALICTQKTFMHITKAKKALLSCFLFLQITNTKSASKNKSIAITPILVSSPNRYLPAIPARHANISRTVKITSMIFCPVRSFKNAGYIFTTI